MNVADVSSSSSSGGDGKDLRGTRVTNSGTADDRLLRSPCCKVSVYVKRQRLTCLLGVRQWTDVALILELT